MRKLILVLALFMVSFGYSQEKTKPPTFEEILTPYVEKLLNFAEQGAEFVVTEIPEVIQQYIYFEAVTDWIGVLLGIGFIFFIRTYIEKRFLIKSEEEPSDSNYSEQGKGYWLKDSSYGEPSLGQVGFYATRVVGLFMGVIMVSVYLTDAIKVTFFPKLFLLEKFIHLVS